MSNCCEASLETQLLDNSICPRNGKQGKMVSIITLKSLLTPDALSQRTTVRHILRKYGYPPDLQAAAVQNVLKQAEALSAAWVAGSSVQIT